MKRLVYIAMVIMLFLAGCISATEQPETANTITDTVIPPPTSTKTPLPTATKRPSATPGIPTATITPMSVAPTSISPLALNEFNAATEMKRLNIIGTGVAHDIKFSPDGKLFAVATGRGIYLYDGTTFEQSGFIDVNDSVSAIAFSPDGGVLAVAVDGKVSLWNVVSGRSMLSLEGGLVGISKLAYGKGGHIAAIGGDCRGCGTPVIAMILWNAKTGRQIYIERDIWYLTQALTFTPDGAKLFYGGVAGLTMIESDTGKSVSVEANSTVQVSYPYNALFNNDGTRLYVTSSEASSRMFDMTAQTQGQLSSCDMYLTGAGEFGACIYDQKIEVFELSTRKTLKTVDTNIDSTPYTNVLFAVSPDGRFLVYEEEGRIRVVSVQDDSLITELKFADFHTAGTSLMILDGVDRYLAAIEYPPGQISLIDLQTSETIRTFKMDCCDITGFAFAPDRRTVATMGDQNLQVWDISSQQVIYETNFRLDFSGPITFSPDGTAIFLTKGYGEYILQYDLRTSESIRVEGYSYQYSYDDLFAADNYRFNGMGNLVLWNRDASVLMFTDLKTQEKINIPFDAGSGLEFPETFTINPDDKYLLLGRYNGISIWDIQAQKFVSLLSGHEQRGGDGWSGAIKSLMFSPQSNLLVSVGWDRTIRLWNIITGNEIRRLNVCCSASFTPDGRYLVTAGDGVIRVWGIP